MSKPSRQWFEIWLLTSTAGGLSLPWLIGVVARLISGPPTIQFFKLPSGLPDPYYEWRWLIAPLTRFLFWAGLTGVVAYHAITLYTSRRAKATTPYGSFLRAKPSKMFVAGLIAILAGAFLYNYVTGTISYPEAEDVRFAVYELRIPGISLIALGSCLIGLNWGLRVKSYADHNNVPIDSGN